MNKTNYKQYDTRWAKLGYPKSPYFIKDCGCGEVAICNSIIEMQKQQKQTPKTIQPYCKQYAAPNGNGTYFSGIPTMMKHYGMTEVKEHETMSSLWKELKKGGRVAIYLMGNRKGGSKGVHWTSSAHFVCSTGYKVKNGKHYLYVKDSNSTSSQRNGWIAYEDNMRNDVSRVWSGKLNGTLYGATTTTKKTVAQIAQEVIDGKWGNGDERVAKLKAAGYDPDAVQKKVNELLEPTWVEKANAWAKKIADSKYHYVVWKSNVSATHTCPICKGRKYDNYYGWNCIGFSFAYWHHGGGLPCKCNCGVIDNSFMTKLLTMDSSEALKQLKKKIGLKDLKLIRNGKKNIPQSKMKAGDLCLIYDSKNKCTHIYPYIGNGYMIDCGGWSDKAKQIAKRKASPCKVIIRYTGK